MVIQIQIDGDLEKRISKLLESKYSYMNKKTFIMLMVQKQVNEEIKKDEK